MLASSRLSLDSRRRDSCEYDVCLSVGEILECPRCYNHLFNTGCEAGLIAMGTLHIKLARGSDTRSAGT